MKKLIATVFLSALPAFCTAFGAATAWDVQAGVGSNTNGGAFDAGVGSPGTDKSEGAATAFTDLVCATTTCTSTTLAFGTASPGNFLYISSGSGCNVGRYEILSQSAGTATLNVTAGTGTCSGNAYGPMATICSTWSSGCTVGAMAGAVSGNTIWLTGSFSACTALNSSACYENINSSNTNVPVTIEGYGSTHGDMGTRPLLTTSTASTAIFLVQANIKFINVGFSETGSAASQVILNNQTNPIGVYNCKCDLSATTGSLCIYLQAGSENVIWNNEFALNSTGYGVVDASGNNGVVDSKWNYAHGGAALLWDDNFPNGQRWFSDGDKCYGMTRCLYQQGGGIILDVSHISCNTITNECARAGGSALSLVTWSNNVVYSATYGLYLAGGATFAFSQLNFYGAIGTANTHSLVASFVADVALSANPFTSSTNFALNSTAGGGAAVKAAGWPGASPGGTGYIDGGAMQSQAPSGGGGAAPYVQ